VAQKHSERQIKNCGADGPEIKVCCYYRKHAFRYVTANRINCRESTVDDLSTIPSSPQAQCGKVIGSRIYQNGILIAEVCP
jgi:hypothetical protein